MKIIVKVKPNSKNEVVQRVNQETLNLGFEKEMDIYKVSVKEPPVNGKANNAVVKALALYFNIPSSRVTLISGSSSKSKIFNINK